MNGLMIMKHLRNNTGNKHRRLSIQLSESPLIGFRLQIISLASKVSMIRPNWAFHRKTLEAISFTYKSIEKTNPLENCNFQGVCRWVGYLEKAGFINLRFKLNNPFVRHEELLSSARRLHVYLSKVYYYT